MVHRIDAHVRGHCRRAAGRHLVAMDAQAHSVQARGVEVAARLVHREETGLTECVGIYGAVRARGGYGLVDQVVDEGTLARELRRQGVGAEKGRYQVRHVRVVAMTRYQVEQLHFPRLVQRVARFCLQRRRAVREHRPKARANRVFIERPGIEQRLARAFDRMEHSERRSLAASSRGEVGLSIAGVERMPVRVDEARDDHAVAPFFDKLSVTGRVNRARASDRDDRAVLDEQGRVIDAAERVEAIPHCGASVSQVTIVLARTIRDANRCLSRRRFRSRARSRRRRGGRRPSRDRS